MPLGAPSKGRYEQRTLYLIGDEQLYLGPSIAIDIDHRITKQQYTTLFHLNGIWVAGRPVEWHANKKSIAKMLNAYHARQHSTTNV